MVSAIEVLREEPIFKLNGAKFLLTQSRFFDLHVSNNSLKVQENTCKHFSHCPMERERKKMRFEKVRENEES